MIKIGIFIIPNFYLKDQIINLKKNVKKRFGFQTYIDHLPHCTLYVFKSIGKNINNLKKIKNISLNEKNFFFLDKTDIFFNDPITKKIHLLLKLKKINF